MALNLNFHQLLLFHMAAKLGSISRAAEALHLSQPSMSVQLREFEQRWGVDLLRRLPRGVELTDAGRVVFDHAERLLSVAEELQSALHSLRRAETGPLTIGGSLTAGEYFLPEVSRLYKLRFPRVEPVLALGNSNGILTQILSRELDLGIVGTEVVKPGLVAIPCWQDEIVIISAPARFSSGSRPLPILSLRSHPFVMREAGSATRQQVEHVLQDHGVTIQAAMTVGSPEAVKRHVMAGLGWGFASVRSVEAELTAGQLVIVAVKGWVCRRQFCAVHRRDHALSQAQVNFVEIAKTFEGQEQMLNAQISRTLRT